jgi:hypothetical protein
MDDRYYNYDDSVIASLIGACMAIVCGVSALLFFFGKWAIIFLVILVVLSLIMLGMFLWGRSTAKKEIIVEYSHLNLPGYIEAVEKLELDYKIEEYSVLGNIYNKKRLIISIPDE